MHGGQAGDDGVVADDDMPGQGGEVGHDDPVAHLDVVGQVGVGQEMVVGTHPGDAAVGGGAVHADVLAEDVAVADAQARAAAAVLEVLGLGPDAGEGDQLAGGAEGGEALDRGV
ncbi:MAG: hypothetical protein ACK55I_29370, partial [bacterium]